ncbi:MAG: hypothetical protein HDS26_01860 [Bacteroides sp.]|nr:hypothetical protein [Bacteroides sp.]
MDSSLFAIPQSDIRRKILIFNPDTDFALGSGSDFYTPPKAAVNQAFFAPLTAARWGTPGDIILIPYPVSPSLLSKWSEEAEAMRFHLIDFNSLQLLHSLKGSDRQTEIHFWDSVSEIDPWGWNRTLRRRLLESGTPERLLPTLDYLQSLRQLSHRRTTILFNNFLADKIAAESPVEFNQVDAALNFMDENPGCWFKLPWSSSGRGVVNSAVNSKDRIEEWIRGGIRRQGSVMGETGADRLLDFATEWKLEKGKADFIGLSLFKVSSRGQYQGNLDITQTEIEKIIGQAITISLKEIISHQKDALESLPINSYGGYLGIDMIAERDGKVRPCVEINLRRTMGMFSSIPKRTV